MIQRPSGIGAFEFVVLATLRAAQLIRGCRPLVDGSHKATVTAQVEVAEGKVGNVGNVGNLTQVSDARGHGAGAPGVTPSVGAPDGALVEDW